ncbi:hypothetical protein LRS11_16180 [Pseudomonas sp. J452]|uniref:hypothetical protein n=1 Tax=Pseudomonas sp. J452 TaxID=2898441 RepID=UPI0021ADD67B|nr:hypothetical protein [Pseudomonas sp. J452]UUY07351.1 hypothetical protein LRS11_16180 [Pseudomonas sp. J452]
MTSDFKSDRYFKNLYSSRLRLSRRVLRAERRAALTLSYFLGNPENTKLEELASDLEWLFTWKLKTGIASEPLWCDGVADIALKQTGKYELQISAMAWVGPEANIEILNKENFAGTLALKPSGKAFKSYSLKLNYNNETLALKKT